MLAVALWIVAALVAALVAAVMLPVRVRLRAHTAPGASLRVDFRPLAGLTPWIRVFDSARRRPPPARSPVRSDSARPKRVKVRRCRRRVSMRRMIRAAPDLGLGLLRVFRIERLRLEGTLGLGDPADTGTIWGIIAPAICAAENALGGRVHLALRPDFERVRLHGSVDGEIQVVLARAIPPVARFGWALLRSRG